MGPLVRVNIEIAHASATSERPIEEGHMRSATRAGFRIAGLMAMTFLIAHCGDSSTHIRTGGGVNPSAGTFQGTLDRDGSAITVVVDSIRSIAFQCDTDDMSQ